MRLLRPFAIDQRVVHILNQIGYRIALCILGLLQKYRSNKKPPYEAVSYCIQNKVRCRIAYDL